MNQRWCVLALLFYGLVTTADGRLGAVSDVNLASSSTGDSLSLTSSSSSSRRQLQQSAFCPDGCDRTPDASGQEGCQQGWTQGGLICVRCKGNLRPNAITGMCSCSPGRYGDITVKDMCLDCPVNYTCPGGTYTYANPPPRIACPSGTLTQVMRAGSNRACVNPPGTSYNYDANLNPFVEPCPADTYSTGFRKQRQCTPCPPGFTTDGLTMQRRASACIVPAGYYLKAPGQVAACPQGEWKGGIGGAANCTKCNFGITTRRFGSTDSKDCGVLMEGYYPKRLDTTTGEVFEAAACPQGYYCPGGVPGQSFDPKAVQGKSLSSSSSSGDVTAQATLSTTEPTIKECPDGMWTAEYGSTNIVQCLTPPGFYTTGGKTQICPDGSFRADWAPAGTATSCTPCGDGVFAVKTDIVTKYDPVTYAKTEISVTTSSEDCYIKAGQGLYYGAIAGTYRAKNCIKDEYGMPNTTFGLTPSPCKTCPSGMVTSSDKANYPNSASYYVSNGDTPLTSGFIDPRACVTQDGWGVSGRGAQKCAQGFFNKKDTYSDCTACDFGTTTSAVGAGVTKADCGIAKGYGFHDGKIVLCPIGTYNDKAYSASVSQPCTPCPDGSTTSQAGGDAVSSCNLCKPGRGSNGGDNCLATCGGPNNPTYGTLGRAFGSACLDCMVAQTGFSFSWGFTNDVFAPKTVAPLGADGPKDCLAEFGQMLDGAWYLTTTGNSGITTYNSVATFADCVAKCSASTCQYVTYDYKTSKCDVRSIQPLVYVGHPLIGFKGIPSGDVGVNAATLKERAEAAAISSGMYTWYQEPNALSVGNQVVAPGAASMKTVQDCITACDNDHTCAGVTIQMLSEVNKRATSCQLIFGNKVNGEFIRSMTRMDINRLAIPPLQ